MKCFLSIWLAVEEDRDRNIDIDTQRGRQTNMRHERGGGIYKTDRQTDRDTDREREKERHREKDRDREKLGTEGM